MNQIKFSHKYPKLWEQKKAELIAVRILNAQAVAINKDLLEYDTRYFDYKESKEFFGYYKLPQEGDLIQLIFVGDKDIPFCTLRTYTDKKYDHYMDNIGQMFEVVLTDVKEVQQ